MDINIENEIKNKKNKKKLIDKIIVVAAIILVGLALTVISIYLIVRISDKKISSSMVYNESGKLNYSVCLKDNDYLGDNCISEERSFVTSLIDHINVDFKYDLNSSSIANYEYNYSVEAIVKANEKGESDKILYSDSEVLKSGNKEISDNNLVIINENIPIDFVKYNEKIKSFKKNYILSMDSILSIIVKLNVKGNTNGIDQTIDKNYVMSFDVPLTEQTVNIIKKDTNISSSDTIFQEEVKSGYSFVGLLCDIFFKLDIIYLVFVVCFIIALIPKQQEYTKKINKLLKAYDSLIVVTKVLPSLEGLKIIRIETFDDVLDAQQALNKPIIYCEDEHKKYSVFAIINDSEAYVYVISA